MKFWKSVISVVVSIFLCVGIVSAANANISINRIKIGNISSNSKMSDVQRMYGKPNKIAKDEDGYIIHTYKNGPNVMYVTYCKQDVWDLSIQGNWNLATKDGVKIGMQESVLKKIYGKPTYISKDKGKIYYSYEDATDGTVTLNFVCKNGKIISIGFGFNI